jgi:hypothetical protein
VLVDLVETAPHGILAHRFTHSQQRWIQRVATERRHVRVIPMVGQDRQEHRAKEIALDGTAGSPPQSCHKEPRLRSPIAASQLGLVDESAGSRLDRVPNKAGPYEPGPCDQN